MQVVSVLEVSHGKEFVKFKMFTHYRGRDGLWPLKARLNQDNGLFNETMCI